MTQEAEDKYKEMRKQRIGKSIKYHRAYIGWASVLILILISYFGVVTPKNTYINCHDPSISHQLLKDTISVPLLIGVCLIVPLLKITIVEWLRPPPSHLGKSRFSRSIKRSLDHACTILVGGLFSFFLVEILKTSVSEARPHFMSSCKPILTKEQCSLTWVHVTWENCSNPYNLTQRKLLDTMKSFPSGHACLGIFTTSFMSAYTHMRLRVSWSHLFRWVFQVLWWLWGLLCCFSRIWDFKHFWWDVTAGGIIGAITGYATVAYVCNWFEVKEELLKEAAVTYHPVRDSPLPSSTNGGDLAMLQALEDEDSQARIKL